MTVKKYKSDYHDYDDYDDEYDGSKKKSLRDHRRPVKNWKKAWYKYTYDHDGLEDFCNKHNK